MPVRTKKVGDKWRVVGPDGKVEKRRDGGAVDGGGFKSKARAVRQVQAINRRKRKK